jgi:hypothetical protein
VCGVEKGLSGHTDALEPTPRTRQFKLLRLPHQGQQFSAELRDLEVLKVAVSGQLSPDDRELPDERGALFICEEIFKNQDASF